MKKYLFILMAAVACLATSCREDLKELDKGSTPLAISANADTLVLDQTEYSNTGLTLSWTSGTNEGTGHRIYYSLELVRAGESWENAKLIFNGQTQKYEQTWTVEDICQMAIDNGCKPGETIGFTARITASGEGFETQTSTCDFVVIPYEPITKTLYIVGNATPGGWTLSEATEMEMKEVGYFKTTLRLKKGFFKFVCNKESMLPGYMPGETSEDLLPRTDAAQQDKMWTVETDHLYEVSVNLITLKMQMREVAAVMPDYEQLYLIGNETGWNFWEMDRDPLDPFLFRIGHFWTIGEDFKFGTASGAWENNFKATSANAPYTQESMVFIKGYDPDNKWVLNADECNKMYKICVDIHTAQERMIMREYVPFTEMYMVGSAAPNGWDLSNATALTLVDDSLFTWTGTLNAGELKFSCDKQADWNGAWFMPAVADQVPTGQPEQLLFIDKNEESLTRYQYAQSENVNVSDIDLKWKIEEAGTYTITLDQLHDRVTIIKQ